MVDPGDEIDEIMAIVSRHHLQVTSIVVTHSHIDHIGGAKKMKQATGAPVYLNEHDLELYKHLGEQASMIGLPTPETTEIDLTLSDGQTLRNGGLQATVLHTPGHTPGSVCLLLKAKESPVLIAGDTLFRDGIGRTDLRGGDTRKILRSLQDKLLPLDDSTIVIPGHGPVTSIGREREFNPFLQNI